jgi:hypothetical protein
MNGPDDDVRFGRGVERLAFAEAVEEAGKEADESLETWLNAMEEADPTEG